MASSDADHVGRDGGGMRTTGPGPGPGPVKREPTRYGGRPDTVLALVLDCADLDRVAAFWCTALGYVTDDRVTDEVTDDRVTDEVTDDAADARGASGSPIAENGEPAQQADRYQRLVPADGKGIELLLQQVGERKTTKNRMHLDLRTRDLTAETARLLAAGARHTTGDLIREDGWSWYVLADPEGNEFCVLRPPDDHPSAW